MNYRLLIDNVSRWCSNNFLNLNVKKTKEVILDFRRKKDDLVNVKINRNDVEVVRSYKYLGVVIDNRLLSLLSNMSLKKYKKIQILDFRRKKDDLVNVKIIRRKKDDLVNVKINRNDVEVVRSYKYLGVVIDNRLLSLLSNMSLKKYKKIQIMLNLTLLHFSTIVLYVLC